MNYRRKDYVFPRTLKEAGMSDDDFTAYIDEQERRAAPIMWAICLLALAVIAVNF